MLDPRLFRTDLDFVKEQLGRRSFNFNPESYLELEAKRKEVQIKTQELQNERNSRSKAIGQAKANGEDVQPLLNQVHYLGDSLKVAETELSAIQLEMEFLMDPSIWVGLFTLIVLELVLGIDNLVFIAILGFSISLGPLGIFGFPSF